MVRLKVGRKVFDIDENDLILDNGNCYILCTKKVWSGYFQVSPKVSKKLFADLKKRELIYTSKELKQAAIDRYGNSLITYWKFNIGKMKNTGY